MADLSTIVGVGSVSGDVRSITGSRQAALKAAGIAAWIDSVTGAPPTVEELEGNRARLLLSDAQHRKMRAWLESLTKTPKVPPKVSVDLGPSIKPFVMKKAIPPAVGVLAAGLLIGYIL